MESGSSRSYLIDVGGGYSPNFVIDSLSDFLVGGFSLQSKWTGTSLHLWGSDSCWTGESSLAKRLLDSVTMAGNVVMTRQF